MSTGGLFFVYVCATLDQRGNQTKKATMRTKRPHKGRVTATEAQDKLHTDSSTRSRTHQGKDASRHKARSLSEEGGEEERGERRGKRKREENHRRAPLCAERKGGNPSERQLGIVSVALLGVHELTPHRTWTKTQ
jgi:hypothetical protein